MSQADPQAPAHHARVTHTSTAPEAWTTKLRRAWLKRLPPEKLLPDNQPAYVASWTYTFGVLTLASLLVTVLSGAVIALEGATWWHLSRLGHFVNSLHLWGVELFMGFMALHLWMKFWIAAWRGRRALTWMTGVAAFMVSIIEDFTGYLSQTNFDSQWISFSAKDAFNSAGIGAFLNAMNFGQALLLHVVVLPAVLVGLVGLHVILVRLRGVVHPFGAGDGSAAVAPVAEPGASSEIESEQAGGVSR